MISDELNKKTFMDLCNEQNGELMEHEVLSGSMDHENGYLSYVEVWRNKEGQNDRSFGPAVIHRDPESGKVFWQEWWSNGKLHRENGPAILVENPITGEIEDKRYYRDGEQYFETFMNGPNFGQASKLDL